jgi:cholesterol oxidase
MAPFDAIVVGSGFGGAVTSCRLAEAGARVLVLERGRRWGPESFPRAPGDPWVFDPANPAKHHGWLDFRAQRGVSVAMGAGVGGGSLIYANVQLDAPPACFDRGWPHAITHDELRPYYARVDQMLTPQLLPEAQLNERFRIVQAAAAATGHATRFRRLPLAVAFNDEWRPGPDHPPVPPSRPWINAHGREQGTCIHCGDCYLGCPVKARNTLDLNYLARAEALGAEVRPLHVVRAIRPEGAGYRVVFDRIEAGRLIPGSEVAPRVIVAAGSLGSTELLLRCRDEYRTLPKLSQALGHGWSTNGDFMTVAIQEAAVNPTHGPTITAAIDFLDGAIDGQRFIVQDGGFPEFFRGVMEAKLKFDRHNLTFSLMVVSLAWVLGRHGRISHMMPWIGQGVDAANGRWYLGRSMRPPWRRRLKLDWNITPSRAMVDAMFGMHKRLAAATRGRPLTPILWTWLRQLITPHPLGGCRMADDASRGVVNHRGEVFGYPNLQVLDGSIIPTPIGLNPSKTIAAVAERAMALERA